MQNAKKTIKTKGKESPFMKPTGQPLIDQWVLFNRPKISNGATRRHYPKQRCLHLEKENGQKFPLLQNGDIAFYKLIKKGVTEAAVREKVIEGQKLLGWMPNA